MNLHDYVRMVRIAAELMLNAKVEDEDLRFAVFHSADMLRRPEKEYDGPLARGALVAKRLMSLEDVGLRRP
jgi:hypothetical protein